jgi:sulfopyruvate decarboxylase TPP-binding subunit
VLIPGQDVARTLVELGVTHVAWLPDSAMGPWETAIVASPIRLLRVCREGEAWALAAGLYLGGARPVVMIQNTGMFESGDALRNVLFDLRLPLYAIIGYRSYLVPDTPDTAKRFTEPILAAWGIEPVLIGAPDELPKLADHYRACQKAGRAGIALLAEGKG